MPYVICSDCRVTTYSAALWSSADECPSCGAPLPSRFRRVVDERPKAPVVPIVPAVTALGDELRRLDRRSP